jgi:hypothetical protein
MRSIGHLPDEAQARVFGDYLVAQGIRNEVEPDTGAAWAVWIKDEDQVAAAQTALAKFRVNPRAEEFRNARSAAAKTREAEARDLADYRRRVRSRRSLFPKFGGYGMGPLTFGLMILCVAVAVKSMLGSDREFLRPCCWPIRIMPTEHFCPRCGPANTGACSPRPSFTSARCTWCSI